MEFTIHVPWLTRTRRLAVGFSLMFVLVAIAMPASAAPPTAMADVTVVNEPDDPVPVAGDVTATVVNDPTNPMPVSAAQGGSWTVGLDTTSADHLKNVDDATSGLTYDENGNLNVNVAGGDPEPGSPVLSTGAALCQSVWIFDGAWERDVLAPVTSITGIGSESALITLWREGTNIYRVRVDPTGIPLAQSMPFPIDADRLRIENLSDVDDLFGEFCITTL